MPILFVSRSRHFLSIAQAIHTHRTEYEYISSWFQTISLAPTNPLFLNCHSQLTLHRIEINRYEINLIKNLKE